MLYDSGYHHMSFSLFSPADLSSNSESFHPRLVSKPILVEAVFLLGWRGGFSQVFVSGALIELFFLVSV